MSDVILDVDGLSVDIATARGPLHAVRDISFSVKRGETLCLVGESGCGKSMTSLAIMDLLPKAATRSARRIAFAGEDLARAGRKRVNALRGVDVAFEPENPLVLAGRTR